MPPGLADAVLAMVLRDRDVATGEVEAITRLAAPDDAVAEVQLDPPSGALAAVIGFAAPGTRPLLAGAGSPALERWLDAVAPTATHWGIKLAAVRQIYARGRFEPAQAVALGAGQSAVELARLLAVTGVQHFAMLGVELSGGVITRHVGYAAVAGTRAAEALAAARRVSAPVDLLAPDPGWLHLSWDLATATGPFKIDAGPRQAGEAIAIATALGLDGAALGARLATLGLGDPSHVGLRAGAPAARPLALYFRVTAS